MTEGELRGALYPRNLEAGGEVINFAIAVSALASILGNEEVRLRALAMTQEVAETVLEAVKENKLPHIAVDVDKSILPIAKTVAERWAQETSRSVVSRGGRLARQIGSTNFYLQTAPQGKIVGSMHVSGRQ